MMNATPNAVHIRSYGMLGAPDRHDFAQLVLPLAGSLLLDIEGRAGTLDPLRAAFVAPRAWHAQGLSGAGANRSLIVDLDAAVIDPLLAERLRERPFPALGPAARKLVEFMGIVAGDGGAAPGSVVDPVAGSSAGSSAGPVAGLVAGWLPLLLDTLALDAPRPASRLAALRARIELDPGQPWNTETMARTAGLSVSRLHALFRAELDATPHGWLLELRLARACAWLAQGKQPIAALALRAGFGDQSALTRALKKAIGQTPAEYRRMQRDDAGREQENAPKTQ